MAMKTPGVYIVEKNAFPNSVVEVATAVPAFIGYTQKAANGGKDLKKVPFRISSMSEFMRYFGGRAQPRFGVALVDANAAPGIAPKPTAARGQATRFKWNGREYALTRGAAKSGGRYLMYQAMQHFFQNGGAACYIVSVGHYDDADDIGVVPLLGGLEPLVKEQEPTMVLVPDAVLLDEPGCILVQQQVLAHCGNEMLRNRVAIFDVWGGDRDGNDPEFDFDPIVAFMNQFRADATAVSQRVYMSCGVYE